MIRDANSLSLPQRLESQGWGGWGGGSPCLPANSSVGEGLTEETQNSQPSKPVFGEEMTSKTPLSGGDQGHVCNWGPCLTVPVK